MRMIDVVIMKHPQLGEFFLERCRCPSSFDMEDLPWEECKNTKCIDCWSREVDDESSCD